MLHTCVKFEINSSSGCGEKLTCSLLNTALEYFNNSEKKMYSNFLFSHFLREKKIKEAETKNEELNKPAQHDKVQKVETGKGAEKGWMKKIFNRKSG